MNDSEPEREIEEAIIGYLADHAEAADTLEGIAEWWLMRQHVAVKLDAIRKVLCDLTARGFLEQSGARDNPRYRLRSRVH